MALIESSQIQPVVSVAVAESNGGTEFGFRNDKVFVFFGNAAGNPVRFGCVKIGKQLDLILRLVPPSTHNTRRFKIELCKVSASFDIAGIKLYRGFKFKAHFFREANSDDKIRRI